VQQHLVEAPVVLLSDRDDVEDVMAALSRGIRGYDPPRPLFLVKYRRKRASSSALR
jgi:hypothetical protein